ncbi:MAG: NAD-glutamate dehydrogenase domain-containing protein, partial [Endozoicomonas sp.]
LEELDGNSIDFNVQLSENPLAQLQFTVHCNNASQLDMDVEGLEATITEAMLGWEDHLQQALLDVFGEGAGSKMARRYARAFPAAYREDVHPRQAVTDIERLESIDQEGQVSTSLYRPVSDFNQWHFRVLGHGALLALSDVLPILEKMGVRVHSARPYPIKASAQASAWVLDFRIEPDSSLNLEDSGLWEQFQQVFVRTWQGSMESDGFNGLVVSSGLDWQQIILLRALAKYLLQLQVPFSQSYMQKVLNGNPAVVRELVDLFHVRFSPAFKGDRNKRSEVIVERIRTLLDEVSNLDEDRILRHFLSVIEAMLRTNAYQKGADGLPKRYIAFKLRPEDIPATPLPRPMFEIFVYSPEFEGVHMRGGKIARGGLRWSDRREDFRTEILGLVKAQMVKNAIIVPHGAKGGFIPKRLPVSGSREAVLAEGINSYRQFISGLLDVTDNFHKGQIVPPDDVIRYDEDDPYLVVAADKGTASFSDIANEVSGDYGFWLGDAFASGGSQGYDHKKMGITARGAWESVKRLFKETGLDTQSQDFKVIGIGDMSGDVFGNGMLLSEHIQLLAAFNHQHIFIDPTPDAASSFQERQRLFHLPRSSWEDYNRELISRGGGVYSRQSKKIRLSPEARQSLGVDKAVMTPSELIQHILKAMADLFWNGGIGTYVKASEETHSEVGDRANDNVRVDASELRVLVVGEGGNLGLTQAARVEFSRGGGLINTDAVDNSGGVDSSDHEVNIKILLNQLVAGGDMTTKQRNQLLAKMTDEVADLVL